MSKLINTFMLPVRALLTVLLTASLSLCFAGSSAAYFQLKVYHFQNNEQEMVIDQYLEEAFIPAMHRLGFSQVGVFKPTENQSKDDKLIYVLFTADKLDQFARLDVELANDSQHTEKGKAYLLAAHDNPPFSRLETILLRAFEGMKQLSTPKLKSDKKNRIYELRSYEASTENYSANKIDMFNNGEIDIFTNLNFNAVFYGQVIAGSTMPNLMYLTCFEDIADREAHWKAFGAPYKPMSELPQYQNNVSKNVTTLCTPASYSDF